MTSCQLNMYDCTSSFDRWFCGVNGTSIEHIIVLADGSSVAAQHDLDNAYIRRNIITAFVDASANHILESMTFAGQGQPKVKAFDRNNNVKKLTDLKHQHHRDG